MTRLLSFRQVECSLGAIGLRASEQRAFDWILDARGLRSDVDGSGKPIPFCTMGATDEVFDLVAQDRWGEDSALDFRFTIRTAVGGRVDPSQVPYAGPWVGWRLHGGEQIHPFRYFRLTPFGAVDWGDVGGGRGRDQDPVCTVAALDFPLTPPTYTNLERWQFRLWLESNPVEPDYRRTELVMACGLEGKYVGTWRYRASAIIVRPLIYVEGSVSTFRVTVDEGEEERR